MKTLITCCLLFSLSSLLAQEHHPVDPDERLGTVSFPISCAPDVQKPFERGVALMHSFEYEEAGQQFEAVALSDPQCAMAYWGQAMSLYHQLWGLPERPELLRGRELTHKAQEAKAKTLREREYINAVALFYRDPDPKTHDVRAKAYSQAMEKIYSKYPQDHEAAAFYALSVLGTSSQTDLVSAKKAVSILKPLLAQEPDHPGIAHYMIHACDNPELAQTGLPAAKQYAALAASSPHAVHMPSHIFARLGLWQADIDSNLAAIDAAKRQASHHMHVGHHSLHSSDFVEYAYLQLGESARAKAILDSMKGVHKDDFPDDLRDYYRGCRTSARCRRRSRSQGPVQCHGRSDAQIAEVLHC